MQVSRGAAVLCAVAVVCGAGPACAQDPPSSVPPKLGAGLDRFLPRGGFEEDGRRTLGAFPRNLGRSFVGVFSRENLTPFVLGTVGTASASFFDGRARAMIAGRSPSFGTTGARAGGAALVPVAGGLFLAGRMSPLGRFRNATYDLAQAMIVNSTYTFALKKTVGRERPDGSDHYSFPSGHASTAFTVATVASHHYGPKVGVPAYVLASAVGLSRLERDRHHLSDVLAGATIGLITARTVTRVNGDRPVRASRFALGPATDAAGGGVGLGVSYSW